MKRTLKGRLIAVLATDGVEKVEISIPVKALKAAGGKVDIIALRHGGIRSVNLHEPASRFHVDKTVNEADPDAYDALLVPGGFINPDLLRQSAEARDFVRQFDRAGKPIASLCHGPWVLESAGLLEGRVLTSWPGVRDDLVNAGATWLDQELVEDGNLLTSRGPQDMVPFVRGILRHFAKDASLNRKTHASESSPQRDEPPQVVITAMRWLPKPSIRTALILGGLGAGLYAMRNRVPVNKLQKQLAKLAA